MRWGQKHFAWWGTSVGDHPIPEGFTVEDMGKCEHAIHFPNIKYEIGVVKDRKNPENYTLLADFWGSGGIARVVGEGGWKFKQAYAMEQSAEAAMNTNQRYEEIQLPDRQRMIIYAN
jgi:hypothetical protein